MPEDRQTQQVSGASAAVLDQRDRLSQARQAGVDGTVDGLAPKRLGAQIQAQDTRIARRRLDVLDDVQVLAVRIVKLANSELQRAVGTLPRDEGLQPVAFDTFDKTETPHSGEFAHQDARLHIRLECRAAQIRVGAIDAVDAFEPVDRLMKALRHLFNHLVDVAKKFVPCLDCKAVMKPKPAQGSQAQPNHEHARRQRNIRTPKIPPPEQPHDFLRCSSQGRAPGRTSPSLDFWSSRRRRPKKWLVNPLLSVPRTRPWGGSSNPETIAVRTSKHIL